MNPLTNVRNIQNLNKRELDLGVPFTQSWHQQYRDSAWIFIGGLDYDLTEGDIICLFSQYGEVVNINLVRDQKTGKSKGFAFLCYENQRSTVLSVDNLNSIKLCGRTIRVDHVEEYKVPKMKEDMAPEKIKLALEGCAPQLQPPPVMRGAGDMGRPAQKQRDGDKRDKAGRHPQPYGGASNDIVKTEPPTQPGDIDLPPRLFDVEPKTENGAAAKKKNKDKKSKKNKKLKKKKSKSKKSKKNKDSDSSSSDSENDSDSESERDGALKKKFDGGRDRVGKGSCSGTSIQGRRPDHSFSDDRDTVRVKEEPRDRGYSSRRDIVSRDDGDYNRGSSARDDAYNRGSSARDDAYNRGSSARDDAYNRGSSARDDTYNRGSSARDDYRGSSMRDGHFNRGSAGRDSKFRVKEEPYSDDSDGYEGGSRGTSSFEGRERRKRDSRPVDDRETREQSRFERNRRDDYSVTGKRKWEDDEVEEGARRNFDEERYDRRSENSRPISTHSSRDRSSNKRDNSLDRGYDRSYDRVRR